MDMENNKLTAERSLEIITKTIEENRREIVAHAGRPLILWGSLVIVTSLLCCYVWQTTQNAWINLSWFVMTAIGFFVEGFLDKKEGKQRATNYINRAVGAVWLAFCVFALSTGALPMLGMALPVTGTILMLMGMACLATGMILKHPIIIACGVVGGLLSVIMAIHLVGPLELLALALAAFIELLLPGVCLNAKSKKR